MKCFSECPPDCEAECGYVEQFSAPHVAEPPTRGEWLFAAVLLALGLALSMLT